MKKKITKIIIVSGVLLGLFGIPLSVYAKCPWCGASTHTSDHCNKYDKDGHPIVQGARQDGRVLEGGRWVNPNSRIDSERANENRGIRETSSSNESQATSSGAPTELTAHEKAIMEWKEAKGHTSENSSKKIDGLLDYLKKEGILKNKIALPVADGIEFIDVNKIMYCKSQSNYTTFHLSDGKKILLSKTISDVEKMLSSYFFIRTHRSFLINPNFMKKYFHSEGGFILMQDDESIPVSNQHKKTIRGIFDAMGKDH